MKVLQVLNHFLPDQVAGTEVYTWALTKELQKHGVEVEIIIPNYHEKYEQEYEYDGLHVHKYAEPSIVDRSLIMGFRDPDGLKDFMRLVQEMSPDIIHFHELVGSNGIGLQHVINAKKTGAKIIFTAHLAGYSCMTGNLINVKGELCNGVININACGKCYLLNKNTSLGKRLFPASRLLQQLNIDTTKWQNKVGTALGTASLVERRSSQLKQLAEHCDQLVVLTRWYEQILIANDVDPAKINFIPQALPSEGKELTKHSSGGGVIRFVFLGRINHFKGLHLLLSAIKEIDSNEISLDIYGPINDDEYYHRCLQMIGDNKNIQWKGVLHQSKVVETLMNYDALCLCSTFSEMSPLVIQEAFAAGIPVIASNVYGNAEQIVDGYNGLLFKFDDIQSLKKKMADCLNSRKLLNELKANIKEPRRFRDVAAAYLKLYNEVLDV